MSEEQKVDIKEDFSGFTEVEIKDPKNVPDNLPPKIDVSEAVHQARQQEMQKHQKHENLRASPGGGCPENMEPPMEYTPRKQQAKPSFWQTLIGRSLTIVVIVALGVGVWWWWNSNKSIAKIVAGSVGGAAKEVGIVENITNTVKKALKLPPGL